MNQIMCMEEFISVFTLGCVALGVLGLAACVAALCCKYASPPIWARVLCAIAASYLTLACLELLFQIRTFAAYPTWGPASRPEQVCVGYTAAPYCLLFWILAIRP